MAMLCKRKAEGTGAEDNKKPKIDADPKPKQKTNKQVKLLFADHGAKGRRQTMEDEHIAWTNEEIHSAFPALPATTRLFFFGIYDGHGGTCTVKFVRERLHVNIASTMVELLDKKAKDDQKKRHKLMTKPEMIKASVAVGFQKTEKEVMERGTAEKWKDGCCVVLVIVVNNVAYIANLGDSKAVLCRQCDAEAGAGAAASIAAKAKGSYKGKTASISLPSSDAIKNAPPVDARCLTKEFTCKLASEKERIEEAGGKIENGRVNGIMEVSRSFGDLSLKRFGVTSEPDLSRYFKITERDEFMLIACDGLWERYNKDMAVKFVRDRIIAHHTFLSRPDLHTKDCIYPEQHWDLKKICYDLVDDAINDKGGQDNTSVMLVVFEAPAAEGQEEKTPTPTAK